VTWPFRESSVIISAELHDKLAHSCAPINLVDSEVLAVRTVQAPRENKCTEQASGGARLIRSAGTEAPRALPRVRRPDTIHCCWPT
jgi:hypothetical protein